MQSNVQFSVETSSKVTEQNNEKDLQIKYLEQFIIKNLSQKSIENMIYDWEVGEVWEDEYDEYGIRKSSIVYRIPVITKDELEEFGLILQYDDTGVYFRDLELLKYENREIAAKFAKKFILPKFYEGMNEKPDEHEV